MRAGTLPRILIVVLLLNLGGCYRSANNGVSQRVESDGDKQQSASGARAFWSIANQADLNATEFFDSTKELKICEAISSGDMEKLRALLESGVELNRPGKSRVTVLHWAFFEDNLPAFELLLEHGADPDIKLHQEFEIARLYAHLVPGRSILFTSLRFGKERFFRAAFKHTSNAHQLNDNGANLLQACLSAGFASEETLKTIIDAGVDVNRTLPFSYSPCHLALFNSRPDLCLQLLKAGADPSVQNDSGQDVADYVEYEIATLSRLGRTHEHFNPLVAWLNENYREIRKPHTSADDASSPEDDRTR